MLGFLRYVSGFCNRLLTYFLKITVYHFYYYVEVLPSHKTMPNIAVLYPLNFHNGDKGKVIWVNSKKKKRSFFGIF